MVKRTRRPAWQAQTASAVARCVLPVPESPIRITLSRSSIQEPSASAAIVAWGTFGFSAKRKSSRRLIAGKRASMQAPALATFGAFGHLGLQQRAEVGDRGLLLAGGFLGERAEAAADGRQLEIDRVRFDQRFQGRGLRVGAGSSCASEQLVVVGEIRRGTLVRRQPRIEIGQRCGRRAAARSAGEDRDGASVVRAGRQRAANGELGAGGPVLAREHRTSTICRAASDGP